MREKLMIVSLVLAVIATAASAHAQDADLYPGNRLQKMHSDHLKDLFGADHPTVVELDAQIQHESNAVTNPEVSLNYTKIEDLDAKSFRRFVVTLMVRIAKLEKEVATLKSRVSDFETSGSPAKSQ